MKKKDYYKILGVEKNAPASGIKAEYRKLAKQWHPDKNPGDKAAEERFKEISEAYAVLSDPEKRKQYDMVGSEKFHQQFSQEDIFRGGNLNDILREMGLGDFSSAFGGRGGGFRINFGETGFGGSGGGFAQNLDAEAELAITFEEAAKGVQKELTIQTGPKRETVKVKIPAGIRAGERLRLTGKGTQARGRRGDLYITVSVAPHPLFRREGDDIIVRAEIDISTALLGGSAEVNTLDGIRSVKVPAGIQLAQKIRVRGQGIRRAGAAAGDLYVEIALRVPAHLTDEQKRLAGELRHAGL
ncbi:MAG: J domain-containing protein [Nitrospinae bacterium]|nr:J domain-containing protein [Nitrospinota bacterium]